jgi:glycosyltransferase involved in cell wall biosynthesis
MPKWVSYLGHRGREALVHAKRLRSGNSQRRVVIFPSFPGAGDAADLRAIALVPELEKLGWRTTLVPSQLELIQRKRILKWERPDVVLLQQSRHEFNHPKYYENEACVFDADDADIFDPRCTDRVIECCRGSAGVIAGSRTLASKFRLYNPNVSVVWTGTYLKPQTRPAPEPGSLPVVTWAHSHPLGYPKEAEFVRQVILRLAARTRFRFYFYGVKPDLRNETEAYLEPMRQAGVAVELFENMEYRKFADSLTRVAVGLHPVDIETPNSFSQGKSFGKLLAYMAAGVAVVTTNGIDHPLFFRDGVNGVLLDNDPESWAEACARLLEDPETRERIVQAATADFQRRLSTARAAQLVAKRFEAVRLARKSNANRG